MGHFEHRLISEGRGRRQPTTVGVKVAECGIKISAVHHLDLSQSTRVTDGRTDGQNYDSQERPRICSRGKNLTVTSVPKQQLRKPGKRN